MRRRLIGLTGGIGTGKTTVSNYLADKYKLPILDADVYAREAVDKGSPILQNISARYGEDILFPDGSLNRKKLGEIIFNNSDERRWLEQQIHPFVRQRFIKTIEKLPPDSTAVLVVPLLFEANFTDIVTEIWVVYCFPEKQLERIMKRDHITLEQAQARINSQISLEEKKQKADVVIENTSTLENLFKQVDLAINRNDF